MDLPLRRRDAELPTTMDRSAPVATFGALRETGKDALGHLDGILNYCRTKVPLGVVEAVNGNIKSLLRRGRGYQVRLNGADHQWGKDPPKEVVG